MLSVRKFTFPAGLIFVLLCDRVWAAPDQPSASTSDRHVLLVVWDGMRPDFVTESNCPTLWRLASEGVRFLNHHSVYLSATEVNGTAINTGSYPAHDGIVANSEYRPQIDPLKAIHTELAAGVRKGDQITGGHFLKMPTIAEIVRASGGRTAVVAAKTIGLLPDRFERETAQRGATVYAGATLPETLIADLTNALGPFPKDTLNSPTRNDWTARALIEHLWRNDVPKFSLLWMNNPDSAQHNFGPGSPQALAGIRDADNNLARALSALDKRGLRASTDVVVASDHGFSTCLRPCDLAADLEKAGFEATREFKHKPQKDEVLVVSNSGSDVIYVIGHGSETIRKLVSFLQQWDCAGVIFSRENIAGTFSLAQAHLNSGDAPDVVVSLRWTPDKNRNDVPGMLFADKSSFGSGQGLHVSLSPFDMHATLIAAGPDFQSATTSELPSGNVDIAPTILHVLGIQQPKQMDGRVLTEALRNGKGPLPAKKSQRLEASASNASHQWHQYLQISEVNGVQYFDQGNGGTEAANK
jgi:arylsulfatase A-like enzyme